MITAEHLKRIAVWSRGLTDQETEVARTGVIEKSFSANEFICMRGDHFEYWMGVVTGLVRIGTGSRDGKAVSFTGMTNGAWFGEGTVLKNEARRYDAVALRDTRLALMDRATFFWLFENSVAFNRFLVGLLNERLGQFMGLVEYGRMLDARPVSRARSRRCSIRSCIRTIPGILKSRRKSSAPFPVSRGRTPTSASRRWRRKACCGWNTAA
jgi:CRP-like cAMP-binding protein